MHMLDGDLEGANVQDERAEERDFYYVTVDQVLPYDLYNYIVLQVRDSA